jgi:hypothetical protein
MKIAVPSILASLSAMSFATFVGAKNVPVEIRWSGTAPTDVLLSVDGGFQPLQRDAGSNTFRGSLDVIGDTPQRHTITVRYGRYYHPFDIRVHRFLPRVSFAIDHQPQGSCTSTRVKEADTLTDSLPDAINRAVNAGELISIPEPNKCDSNLRFGAMRAKYRQNVRMSHLSNGFFLINPEVSAEYKQAARQRGVSVDAEVAAYAKQDEQLEARQLLVLRSNAQAEGNYAFAVELNSYISDRLATDSTIAALYRSQGVTSVGLATDAKYLGAMAAQQAAAASEEIQPDTPQPERP